MNIGLGNMLKSADRLRIFPTEPLCYNFWCCSCQWWTAIAGRNKDGYAHWLGSYCEWYLDRNAYISAGKGVSESVAGFVTCYSHFP